MAPEQARAERTLTSAADVFSLGGVLAFAATGLPPFGEGSGHDVFYRIVHQGPDLARLRTMDPALAALVESCLAKDPDARPSAAELASFASANTMPGPVAWPRVTSERISVRRAFAAAAPVAEFDGTELESSWIGELGQLPVPVAIPAADANAEAETEPVPPKNGDPVEIVPGPNSIGEDAQRRTRLPRPSRKTLTLLLPLLLVLGGTAGTLFRVAPWTTNNASDDDNGDKIVTATSASGALGSATPAATGSFSPTASTTPSPSAKASSPAAKRSSVIVNDGNDIYLSKSTTSYHIDNIPAGTTECVKLRAVNSAGSSAWVSGCQNVG